jgi:hypothetical protein
VYRLVLITPYPCYLSVRTIKMSGNQDRHTNLCTTWGRNSWTACSGTPKQTSIAKKAHVEGCVKILRALPNLNSSLTTDELSVWIRWTAISRCSGVKKWAVAAFRGRYQNAKAETMMVADPSMMKR